jgi:hypothetical protein
MAAPKSQTVCCWATEEPSPSHLCSPLQPVSSLSSRAAPQFSPTAWAALEVAMHWFQVHRHRSHSARTCRSVLEETPSRIRYRAEL